MSEPVKNPRVGMMATVRNRRGLVVSVDPFDANPEGRLHLVRIEYPGPGYAVPGRAGATRPVRQRARTDQAPEATVNRFEAPRGTPRSAGIAPGAIRGTPSSAAIAPGASRGAPSSAATPFCAARGTPSAAATSPRATRRPPKVCGHGFLCLARCSERCRHTFLCRARHPERCRHSFLCLARHPELCGHSSRRDATASERLRAPLFEAKHPSPRAARTPRRPGSKRRK